MPIAVTVELHLEPDHAAGYIDYITQALTDTRQQPGFIAIDVLSNVDQPGRLLFVERWETKADYQAYFEWRRSGGNFDRLRQVLTQPMKVSFYEVAA